MEAGLRRRLARLLIAAICIGGLVWAVYSLGPRRVLDVALRADPVWLGLSALPIVGRFFIWGVKWTRMLRRRSPVPYGLALRLLAAGSFLNLTTPTAKIAGGLYRAAMLRRYRGWPVSEAYGWAMADQVTNVLGHLLLFGMLALFAAVTRPGLDDRTALGLAGSLVLVALLAGVGLRGRVWQLVQDPRVGQRLARWIPARVGGEGRTPGDALARILSPLLHEGGAFGTFFVDLLWAAAAFASICAANAMVLRALGVDASLLLISIAVVLGYFAGVLVGVWGGVGVTEAALTGLYVQLGVPLDQAAAGALLHRAVLYLVVLGAGGLAFLHEGRGVTRRSAAERRYR